jgi:hypothetical protein
MTDELIVNRVTKSGIVTFDLAEYFPDGIISGIDIKDWLYQGLILKEADFRNYLEIHNWSVYKDNFIYVHCSADAIIPLWAYMLVAMKLEPYAKYFVLGSEKELLEAWYIKELSDIKPEEYKDVRVVIKGCGDKPVPESAYMEITRILLPYAKSIMYGEPCSTVPVYKKK